MSLLAGTKLRDWPHLFLNLGQIAGCRHGAKTLVRLLDIIYEMQVVGAPQDHHLLRRRGPLEDFVHSIQGKASIELGNQVQGCDFTSPLEVQRGRNDAGSAVRTSA